MAVDFAWEQCVNCGVQFALPALLQKQCKTEGPKKSFYCPNGYSMVYTESDADKMRRERDRAVQQLARAEDEAREARTLAEQEKHKRSLAEKREKRLKQRAAGGTCACCNRTFSSLAKHMKTKHPDFVSGTDQEAP